MRLGTQPHCAVHARQHEQQSPYMVQILEVNPKASQQPMGDAKSLMREARFEDSIDLLRRAVWLVPSLRPGWAGVQL